MDHGNKLVGRGGFDAELYCVCMFVYTHIHWVGPLIILRNWQYMGTQLEAKKPQILQTWAQIISPFQYQITYEAIVYPDLTSMSCITFLLTTQPKY